MKAIFTHRPIPVTAIRFLPTVFVLWALVLSGCPGGATLAPCRDQSDCGEGWICENGRCQPNSSLPEADSDNDADPYEIDDAEPFSNVECCDPFIGVQGDWIRCSDSGDIEICHAVDETPPEDCSTPCQCEPYAECERGCYDPPNEIGGAICLENGECGPPPERPDCNPALECHENILVSCNTDELVLRSFPECWQFLCKEVQTCDISCQTVDECQAECEGDGCMPPGSDFDCDPKCENNAIHMPYPLYVGAPECWLCTYDVEPCEEGDVCYLAPGEYAPQCYSDTDCSLVPMPDCSGEAHCREDLDPSLVYQSSTEIKDFPECWGCVDIPLYDCGEGFCFTSGDSVGCHNWPECADVEPIACEEETFCRDGNVMAEEPVPVASPICWECQEYLHEECADGTSCQLGEDGSIKCAPYSSECGNRPPPPCLGQVCYDTGIYSLSGPIYLGPPQCWTCEYDVIEECMIGTHGTCVVGTDGPICCNGKDDYEPNNLYGTATEIELSEEYSGTVCGQDIDWFHLDAPAWRTFTVRFDASGAVDDTEAKIYVNSREVYSETGQSQFYVDTQTEDGDSEILLRFAQNGFETANYGFRVDISGWGCPEDVWEPNDDDDSATDIMNEVAQTDGVWVIDDLWACDVSDFFLIPETGEPLDIIVMPGEAATPYERNLITSILYGNSRDVLDSRDNLSSDHRYSGVELSYYDDIQLEVKTYGIPVRYSLIIRPSSQNPCPQDAYEPNDHIGATVEMNLGDTIADLWACQDEDWFALPSGSLRVRVLPGLSEGFWESWPVDTSIFMGNILYETSPPLIGPHEHVVEVPQGEPWFLKVQGQEIEGYPYSIEIIEETPECPADEFEPNDDHNSASLLEEGQTPMLTSCADDDYFRFTIPAGYTAKLSMRFFDRNDALTVVGDGESGAQTYIATSGMEREVEFEADDSTSRDYLLGIGNPAGRENRYVLQWELFPPVQDCIDQYEPNNYAALRTELEPGTYVGLELCDDDEDWYAVEVGPGMRLKAAIEFEGGDLDLTLRNAGGILLDTSANLSMEGREEVETVNLVGTVFYLLQVSGKFDPQALYSLEISVEDAAQDCVDDGYEDNDTSDDAVTLEEGSPLDLAICPDDEDWFLVTIPGTRRGVVHLEEGSEPAGLSLELHDPDTGALLDQSDSNEAVKELSLDNLFAAERNVLVKVSARLRISYTYSLSFFTRTYPGDCVDDRYEDNENPEDARELTAPGVEANLMICSGDDDWYFMEVETGYDLGIQVLFEHEEGNIDAVLYESDGQTEAAAGRSLTDNENLPTIGAAGYPRYYLLRVFGVSGAQNPYSLVLFSDTSGECRNDIFETNETYETAASIDPDDYPNLTLCPGDHDWYALNLTRNRFMMASIHFDGGANLDLELYDENLTRIAESTDQDSNSETVAIPSVEQTGRYYLHVLGESGAGTGYRLHVETRNAIGECRDDAYEPNNSRQTASVIDEDGQPYSGLQICEGEEESDADWYAMELQDDDTVELDVLFSHDAGDLLLNTYRPDGTLFAQSNGSSSMNNRESVYLNRVSGGRWTFEIRSVDNVRNSYSISVDVGHGLCSICAGDQDCGGDDDFCAILGGSGLPPVCTRHCSSYSDCPQGFSCMPLFDLLDYQCIPNDWSRCEVP